MLTYMSHFTGYLYMYYISILYLWVRNIFIYIVDVRVVSLHAYGNLAEAMRFGQKCNEKGKLMVDV